MQDDYGKDVAQETGKWFNYAGKYSWEISRMELVEAIIELQKYSQETANIYDHQLNVMTEIARNFHEKRGLLSRLFG